jgi:hypothetical protein
MDIASAEQASVWFIFIETITEDLIYYKKSKLSTKTFLATQKKFHSRPGGQTWPG